MKSLAAVLQRLLSLFFIKIMVALGLTAVTYTGYTFIFNQFKDYFSLHFNSLPPDILNLMLIAGVGQGIGYIFGAYSFRISLDFMSKVTSTVGGVG